MDDKPRSSGFCLYKFVKTPNGSLNIVYRFMSPAQNETIADALKAAGNVTESGVAK